MEITEKRYGNGRKKDGRRTGGEVGIKILDDQGGRAASRNVRKGAEVGFLHD